MNEPKGTQIERLTRIETILEQKVVSELADLRDEVKLLRQAQEKDVADLALLKHRGIGILIGVSMAATAFGASVASFWKAILANINGG